MSGEFEDRLERRNYEHDDEWRDFCDETGQDPHDISTWRERWKEKIQELWDSI